MKKKLLVSVLLVLSIFSVVCYIRYQQYEKKQQEEREYNNKIKFVMYVMGYWEIIWSDSTLSYEERYYQEMLKDQEVSMRLDYLNYYVQKEFPDISYQEITMNELEDFPLEVYKKMQCLEEDLNRKGEDLKDVSVHAYIQILEDQIYIMQFMGFEKLKQDFDGTYIQSTEYYEEQFFLDEELPEKLEKLNQNINTKFPGEYEKITIERIINDQLQVVNELREIEQKCPDILG